MSYRVGTKTECVEVHEVPLLTNCRLQYLVFGRSKQRPLVAIVIPTYNLKLLSHDFKDEFRSVEGVDHFHVNGFGCGGGVFCTTLGLALLLLLLLLLDLSKFVPDLFRDGAEMGMWMMRLNVPCETFEDRGPPVPRGGGNIIIIVVVDTGITHNSCQEQGRIFNRIQGIWLHRPTSCLAGTNDLSSRNHTAFAGSQCHHGCVPVPVCM